MLKFNKKIILLEVVIFLIVITSIILVSVFIKSQTRIKIGAEADATLSFQVPNATPTPGAPINLPIAQNVNIDVMATTGASNIEAIEAVIKYDPTVLSAKQINIDSVSLMPYIFSQQIKKDANGNEAGDINIKVGTANTVTLTDYQCLPSLSAPFKIATITFTTLKNTSTSDLIFDFTPGGINDSNIVLCVKGTVNYPPGTPTPTVAPAGIDVLGGVTNLNFSVGTVAPDTTLTLTPTPTGSNAASPTPTPTNMPNTFTGAITFQLKGVESKSDQATIDYRNNNPVSVNYLIYDKNNSSINISGRQAAHFTPSSPVTYSLIINNIPDAMRTNAIIWLKADKHLAARICTIGQTSSKCNLNSTPTEGISFMGLPGAPLTADLGSYPLSPGDVNQDGVLNGVDVVEMLTELAKVPSDRNLRYDLNYDGVVIGEDYALMLNSMSVYEDE